MLYDEDVMVMPCISQAFISQLSVVYKMIDNS